MCHMQGNMTWKTSFNSPDFWMPDIVSKITKMRNYAPKDMAWIQVRYQENFKV